MPPYPDRERGVSAIRIFRSVVDLIGRTPAVRLNRIPSSGSAEIVVKLEWFNPGRSVKDRAASAMIAAAEASGRLQPGATIIEPTSGNTGIGLCMVAAAKGYRCIITMPDNASRERVALMRGYGAEVVLTPASLRMQGAIDRAFQIAAEIPGSFIPMQFENPANPEIHRRTTALEILDQTDGFLHAFVATAGTGGTITGVGEVLRERVPGIEIHVVEPAGSPVLAGGRPGPHKIPGTGPGFIPKILNTKIYDRIWHIADGDAQALARRLAREEGLLLGASGAAAVWAALQVAARLGEGKRVLAMAPDTGERYLSTDLYDA